jgi:hypothetical protein
LPALSGSKSGDSADGIFYLKTTGKTTWRHLETKYDVQHGALFELGIKLELLRMLHNDPELQKGLIVSIKRLAEKGGVASAASGVTALAADASSADVGRAIDAATALVDTEVTRAKSPEPVAAPTPKPRSPPRAPRPSAAKASPAAAGTGVSDEDRFVFTVH